MQKVAEIETTRPDPWLELPTAKGGGSSFRISTIKAVTEHGLDKKRCWVWLHGSDGPVSEITLTRQEVFKRIGQLEGEK